MYHPVVVSLFNGIGVGSLALHRLGVTPEAFYISEIDDDANEVAITRWPSSIQLGSVQGIVAGGVERGSVDIVMGGSPCQSFSIAGKRKGFSDPRGMLIHEFIRIVDWYRPRWFLLENVEMPAHCMKAVSSLLGVKPVVLNSSRFCAQHRCRVYWTNIPIPPLPKRSHEVLADVMGLAEPDIRFGVPVRTGVVKKGGQGDRIYSSDGKAITLSASSGGTAGPANMLVGVPGDWRKLTVVEAERLQMLPSGYTSVVSPSARRRLIGNSWTVGVIQHILSGIPAISVARGLLMV